LDYVEVWRDPRLLLGQGCEYPLARSFARVIRVVAVPQYRVPGCEGSRYCSAIVVPRDHPAARLADLRNGRCVINAIDSNSGMNLLRAAVAPLARGARFFQSVIVSGAHRRSAEMIVNGEADVAALDCVSFAHLQRLHPAMMSGLRVLGRTPSSPSLPYITARATGDAALLALRAALKQVIADPALAAVRAILYLGDIDVDPDPSFAEVLRLEQQAIGWGYPELA
jgi:ABC-type phosphate/phosphonate transport system substrate-binding protein